MVKTLDFETDEKNRREYVELLRSFSSTNFELEKWNELRKFVYHIIPLKTDIIIDDTTLREGLQMADLMNPTPQDMCHIACLLRDVGVERIEVMIYTKTDQDAIYLMQDEDLTDILAGWCRASKEDVDLTLKLGFKQIGISHPVSFSHLEKWADKGLQKIVENIVNTIEYAVDHDLKVFFHGEDSTRADWHFERKLVNAVAEAGAVVYRICDTIGAGMSDPNVPLPLGIPTKIKKLREETSIPYLEIHAHDDLGNAVENTFAAIRTAAELYDKFYVSSTFIGIGDRTGNAETEKIIMNCYMHHGIGKWNLQRLRCTANQIAQMLNHYLPQNKSIVGDGAFKHESGIHLHGISILPMTYEIFPPELVGQKRRIVVGKRTGKHGIRLKVEENIGKKINEEDPRLLKLIQIIRDEFASGDRRFPFAEGEFIELMQQAGFRRQENSQ